MRRLPRFAVAQSNVKGATALITGSELHHMRHVMRLVPGSEIVLWSDAGTEYRGRISAFEPDAAIIAIAAGHEHQNANAGRLIVAAALIKTPRMDLLVEKAAELGAAELWPLICARSLIRDPGAERYQRWRRISLAATKQSLRAGPMQIRPARDVAAAVRNVPKEALAVACVPGGEPLSAVLRRAARPAVVLACGPEGDFNPAEVARMREAGFVTAGLGANRLRSETAVLAALAIAAGVFHELGKGL